MTSPALSKIFLLNKISQYDFSEFKDVVQAKLNQGKRLVTYYGNRKSSSEISLTIVFIDQANELWVDRFSSIDGLKLPSLVNDYPLFHIFEREIWEQTGLCFEGHPWLKPLRFSSNSNHRIDDYPFFCVQGREIHEVGVGPIHAGIIEPGHFRFMCQGEKVEHLEIQLGYQHRGIEKLLLGQNPKKLLPLIESVAGDSSIAYAIAYAQSLEKLCQIQVSADVKLLRMIGLELERIAMHLTGLAGIATDVGFLPGSSTYSRLRTAVINTMMRISGSRFGRGWIRPGGIRFGLDSKMRTEIIGILKSLQKDIQIINDCMFSARSVRSRLKNVGKISAEDAKNLGLVGMIARSCGVFIDLRFGELSWKDYLHQPINLANTSGDCFARSLFRRDEIDASIKWLFSVLENDLSPSMTLLDALIPNSLVITLIEGWRGEIVHCLETDARGNLLHYRLQDPSLRNWFGLAYAMRNNEISDFPICNKSFDLSYCGNDL